jgi:hypothetical protein
VDGDSEMMESEVVAKEVADGELVTEQREKSLPASQTHAPGFDSVPSVHPEDDTEEPANPLEIPGDAAELEEADDDDMLSELSDGDDFQVCI